MLEVYLHQIENRPSEGGYLSIFGMSWALIPCAYESTERGFMSTRTEIDRGRTGILGFHRQLDVPPHISQSHRSSNLKIWLGKVVRRYARLHELFLELRNFAHRILVLCSKEHNPTVETGLIYERLPNGFLRLNRKTRARIDCIQKLQTSQPWLSPADFRLILLGWEQGRQFGVSLVSDTQESTERP